MKHIEYTIYDLYDERYIALQLARKKNVDLHELQFSYSVEKYNICNKHQCNLTDEEYRLLKRNYDVLKKEFTK